MSLLFLGVGTVLVLAVAMSVGGLLANRLPLRDPPGLLPRLAVYLTRNVADTASPSGFPELAPLHLVGDATRLLETIAEACVSLDWEEVVTDLPGQRVAAVVRSKRLGFRDDIEITLLESSPDGVLARVRSASRIGRGDLGANTRHVMDLRERLSAEGILRGEQQP